MTEEEDKPVVHQLGGTVNAGPKGEQAAHGCDECLGVGWIDNGATSCPECNTPPTCRCVEPRANKSGKFCLGCGQALERPEDDDSEPGVDSDTEDQDSETTP